MEHSTCPFVRARAHLYLCDSVYRGIYIARDGTQYVLFVRIFSARRAPSIDGLVRRRRRRRRAVDTPRRAWFAADDDVFRRPVLHPRGRRAREDVWVTQRYAMRCDAMRCVTFALSDSAYSGAAGAHGDDARRACAMARMTRMTRRGARWRAMTRLIARVGIVEKNNLRRRRAWFLARDVRRRGCDEREMRD